MPSRRRTSELMAIVPAAAGNCATQRRTTSSISSISSISSNNTNTPHTTTRVPTQSSNTQETPMLMIDQNDDDDDTASPPAPPPSPDRPVLQHPPVFEQPSPVHSQTSIDPSSSHSDSSGDEGVYTALSSNSSRRSCASPIVLRPVSPFASLDRRLEQLAVHNAALLKRTTEGYQRLVSEAPTVFKLPLAKIAAAQSRDGALAAHLTDPAEAAWPTTPSPRDSCRLSDTSPSAPASTAEPGWPLIEEEQEPTMPLFRATPDAEEDARCDATPDLVSEWVAELVSRSIRLAAAEAA